MNMDAKPDSKAIAVQVDMKGLRLLPSSVLAGVFSGQIQVMREDGMTWPEVALSLEEKVGRPVSCVGLRRNWKPPVGCSPCVQSRKRPHSRMSKAAKFLFPSLEALRLAGKDWEGIAKECSRIGLFTVSGETVRMMWKRGAP